MIGRFNRIDPVAEHFPWLTSYQYASNNPSTKIDLDGLEGIIPFEPLLFEENAIIPKGTTTGSGYSPENIARAGGDVAKGGSKFSPETIENFKRGNKVEAEQLAKNGLEKNTKPFKVVDPKTGKEVKTIPDALKNGGKSTVEIKNTKQQGMTEQLRAQEQISNGNGFNPELWINEGAKLSKPLKNSSYDISFYQTTPVTLKTDATQNTPTPVAPPSTERQQSKWASFYPQEF